MTTAPHRPSRPTSTGNCSTCSAVSNSASKRAKSRSRSTSSSTAAKRRLVSPPIAVGLSRSRSSTLCANAISSDASPGTRASTIAAAICDGVTVMCGLGKSSNEATSDLARPTKGASAFILALVAGLGSGAGISSPHLVQAPAEPVSPHPEHSPPANIRLSWNFPGVSSRAAPHASQTSPLASFSTPQASQQKKRSVVSSGMRLV